MFAAAVEFGRVFDIGFVSAGPARLFIFVILCYS